VTYAGRMMGRKTGYRLARRVVLGRRRVIGCLIAGLLGLGVAAHGGAPDSHLVAVDFENVDLRVFIKFVSEMTGHIFLLDERVRGQVSVRFAEKIPVDRLPEVLDSVLEVKGFTTVPAGPITKIVPMGGAQQRGIEVSGGGAAGAGSRR
jgi:general secretion pathway protein D